MLAPFAFNAHFMSWSGGRILVNFRGALSEIWINTMYNITIACPVPYPHAVLSPRCAIRIAICEPARRRRCVRTCRAPTETHMLRPRRARTARGGAVSGLRYRMSGLITA